MPFAGIVLAAILGACGPRVGFEPGDECELNTECKAPLVCRLGHCRIECRDHRDCGPRFECVYDADGLGVCQFQEETECELTSDCSEGLVCRFNRCTNECEEDRDCVPGSSCVEEPGVGFGCRDQSIDECALTSECSDGLICAVDHRCREECRVDWDCRAEMVCVQASPRYCALPPRMDGGVSDAGTDAGMDAGMTDAGTIVTPPLAPRLSARIGHTCFVTASGDAACWGRNDQSQIGSPGAPSPATTPALVGLTGVTVVGTGSMHSCAIAGGTLYCWGDNASGQLGTNDGVDHGTPTAVTLPAAAVDVSLGENHTCAIITGGRMFCWGTNDQGELGVDATLGAPAGHPAPVEVTGFSGVPMRVSTHTMHTCVRMESGTVDCFGDDQYGQLGDDGDVDVLTPQPVPGLNGVVQISVGANHSCAVRGNGELLCWGQDESGQVGDGDEILPELGQRTPKIVPVPEVVTQVATGGLHTCARTASGVYCWGNNSYRQTGSPSVFPLFWPTPILPVGIVEEIAAGSTYTCVIADSTIDPPVLRCFGDNMNGQLGNGTTGVGGATPVTVVWP